MISGVLVTYTFTAMIMGHLIGKGAEKIGKAGAIEFRKRVLKKQ